MNMRNRALALALMLAVAACENRPEPVVASVDPQANVTVATVSSAAAAAPLAPTATGGGAVDTSSAPREVPPTGWYVVRIDAVSNTCSTPLFTGPMGKQFVMRTGPQRTGEWRMNFPALPLALQGKPGEPAPRPQGRDDATAAPRLDPSRASRMAYAIRELSPTGFTLAAIETGRIANGKFESWTPEPSAARGGCRSERLAHFDLVKACVAPCGAVFDAQHLEPDSPGYREPCVCPGEPDFDRITK